MSIARLEDGTAWLLRRIKPPPYGCATTVELGRGRQLIGIHPNDLVQWQLVEAGGIEPVAELGPHAAMDASQVIDALSRPLKLAPLQTIRHFRIAPIAELGDPLLDDALQRLRTSSHAFAYPLDGGVRIELRPGVGWWRSPVLELRQWQRVAEAAGIDASLPYASDAPIFETPYGTRVDGAVPFTVYLRLHQPPPSFERSRLRIAVLPRPEGDTESHESSQTFEGELLAPWNDRWVLHGALTKNLVTVRSRRWMASVHYHLDTVVAQAAEGVRSGIHVRVELREPVPAPFELDVEPQVRELPLVHREGDLETYSGLVVFELDVHFR